MAHWVHQHALSPDQGFAQRARERQSQLTKPPGSLGRLERLAVDLCALQGRDQPAAEHVEIVVFAGDHGVVEEGVSAFPQAVTGEMIKNFVRGGAAISVLAQQLDAGLTVVNMGTVSGEDFGDPVVGRPVAASTRNLVREPAMTAEQCDQALAVGREMVAQFTDQVDILVGGEMGIGNTTSASALACALGAGNPEELCGPGTGLDRDGVSLKSRIVSRALERVGDRNSVLEILAEFGGFEIAALTGFYIAASQKGLVCLVDGFITSVAALVACRINPGCRPWLVFSHTSAEPGHAKILSALDGKPLLNLEMRLGEGSGAGVAVSLLRNACALHNGMATFAEASVSDGS